ncbi:hypothetical protein K435DRAFT_867688 [Dendrothele bispora CBS 962.96]|uniref:Uncharacterized protein n=1 Tax=Dendrothele bispora (strain CBS 962.96) TaxID=1314807 RepID=A0A4S8LEA9_DENBC|nr:hypothetical protein K435DRAFT_867688 [Dendrothele bispora CBS 962.96]
MSSPTSSPSALAAMRSPPPSPASIRNRNTRTPPRQVNLGRRSRDEDDTEIEGSLLAAPHIQLTASANDIEHARVLATRRRLKPQQITDVEDCMNALFPLQIARLLIELHANNNLSSEIKNISNCVKSVLLSTKLSAYKGEVPVRHIDTLIKKFRWGVPEGLEHDTAAWDRIKDFISTQLTNRRSTMKKKFRQSLTGSKDVCETETSDTLKSGLLPGDQRWSIYKLTKELTNNTQATVTSVLCARIAVMVFMKFPGERFWDEVDKKLEVMRRDASKDAENDSEKRQRHLFEHYLHEDRRLHGKSTSSEQLTIDKNDKDADSTQNYQNNINAAIKTRDTQEEAMEDTCQDTGEIEEEKPMGHGQQQSQRGSSTPVEPSDGDFQEDD